MEDHKPFIIHQCKLGHSPEVVDTGWGFYVQCDDCDLKLGYDPVPDEGGMHDEGNFATREAAIEAWNRLFELKSNLSVGDKVRVVGSDVEFCIKEFFLWNHDGKEYPAAAGQSLHIDIKVFWPIHELERIPEGTNA
jgi:hypothetical protein